MDHPITPTFPITHHHHHHPTQPIHVNQYNLPEDNMELGGGIHAGFTLISDKLKQAGYKTHMVRPLRPSLRPRNVTARPTPATTRPSRWANGTVG